MNDEELNDILKRVTAHERQCQAEKQAHVRAVGRLQTDLFQRDMRMRDSVGFIAALQGATLVLVVVHVALDVIEAFLGF